jgi:sigma-B regulation protein RsbU (phosphoserine phosphatase)
MKILCIDDDPGVLIFLNAALVKEHDVTTANSGEEGLEHFKEKGPFPIVISDIQMPGISGYEVVAEIKKVQKDTVCVLITGLADFDSTQAGIEEGIFENFLLKPLVLKTFRETVKECIELAKQRRQAHT